MSGNAMKYFVIAGIPGIPGTVLFALFPCFFFFKKLIYSHPRPSSQNIYSWKHVVIFGYSSMEIICENYYTSLASSLPWSPPHPHPFSVSYTCKIESICSFVMAPQKMEKRRLDEGQWSPPLCGTLSKNIMFKKAYYCTGSGCLAFSSIMKKWWYTK